MSADKEEQRKWWHIDSQMVFVKLGFLLYGAQKSSYVPYLTIFLSSIGFNLDEVGVIVAVKKTGFILGSLFWSMLADKTQARRTIVFLVCVLFAVFNTSQPFLSALLGPKEYNSCHGDSTFNETVRTDHVRNSGHWSWNGIFYMILLLNFTAGFVEQAYLFMKEVTAYKIKQSKRNPQYGRQFMFATIGYGTANTISGKIMKTFPSAPISCYSAVFLFCLALTVLQTIIMQIIYKSEKVEAEVISSENETSDYSVSNYCKELCRVLKKTDIIMHYATVLVSGFLYQVYISYFFIFLRSLHAPHILIGLTIASGSISGLLTSLNASWLIEKARGVWNAFAVVMGLWTASYLFFAYLINPWWVIPWKLLMHGASINFSLVLAVEYLKQKSVPNSVRTTLFGIQSCLFNGVGPIIGSLFGGYVYRRQGARKLFLAMAAVGGVWAIVIVIYRTVLFLRKDNGDKRKVNVSEQGQTNLAVSMDEVTKF